MCVQYLVLNKRIMSVDDDECIMRMVLVIEKVNNDEIDGTSDGMLMLNPDLNKR